MRRYEMISTMFFMALGAYVSLSGWRMGFGSWQEPGPGLIAVLAGGVLFGLSGLWCVMSLLKDWGLGAAKRFFPEAGSARRVGLLALGLVGFTLILEHTGFIIACFLLMLFLLRAIEPQKWRLSLVFAIVTTIVCVAVFQFWLKVEFPDGPINTYAVQKWIMGWTRFRI